MKNVSMPFLYFVFTWAGFCQTFFIFKSTSLIFKLIKAASLTPVSPVNAMMALFHFSASVWQGIEVRTLFTSSIVGTGRSLEEQLARRSFCESCR